MDNPNYALRTDFVLRGDKNYFNFRFLNKGGYGITYLANATFYDGRIKQTGTYAIKEYYPSDIALRNDDGSVAAVTSKKAEFDESYNEFEQEGEMLHQIKHKGIVPVNEVIKANGTIYYVMSYLGDTSLVKYVQNKGGKLSEDEACQLMNGLIDAVGYLHSKQLNHLDIKPDNVMMEQVSGGDYQPVLIDFGLSKHFKPNGKQTSRLGGKGVTDGFSPLEQYAGISTFSPQADIYALGATMFYMLTGTVPPKANEVNEEKIRNSLPKSLSKRTIDVICNAMNRDLYQRPQKVESFFKGTFSSGGTVKIDAKNPNINTSFDLPMKKIIIGFVVAALVFLLWKPVNNMLQDDLEQPVSSLEAGQSESTDNDSTEMKDEPIKETIEGEEITSEANDKKEITSVTENKPQPNPQKETVSHDTPSSIQSHVTRQEDVITTGTKNLGFAIYEGEMKNGQPDGEGTLTFQEAHAIDSRDNQKKAEAGDVVKGKFEEGHLLYGTWNKVSGETVKVLIGK